MSEQGAEFITFDGDKMLVHLRGRRVLGVPLSAFVRLLHTPPAQREAYLISGDGSGLHWDELDEDISVPHLLMAFGDGVERCGLTARN